LFDNLDLDGLSVRYMLPLSILLLVLGFFCSNIVLVHLDFLRVDPWPVYYIQVENKPSFNYFQFKKVLIIYNSKNMF
jgi:hypothetical protein